MQRIETETINRKIIEGQKMTNIYHSLTSCFMFASGRLLGLWPGSHYSQKPKLAHAKTSKNLKPQTEVPKI